MNLTPRHQAAAAWCAELEEHVVWMTPTARRLFLEAASEMAMRHLEVATTATIAHKCGVATELAAELSRVIDE